MTRKLLEYSFSGSLKRVLEEHGITQYKFSQTSGLDPGHVSRLVNGSRNRPESKTMQKIALALARLGVSDSDISRVQSSAGFGGFDDKTEDVVLAVKTASRPRRQRRPKPTSIDPSEITFDVANPPPPPRPTKQAEPAIVLPKKLNMGDQSKFVSKLEKPKWVSLEVFDPDGNLITTCPSVD